ncbi:MAG: molybdopterin-guanine dinucleotide biosynthesis protein MobB, partial [Desulfuromonadales bacterium]|nr:molybdopterin-guanine dinucleotide biosynthesis protein MobB [Desulfuromonadales bacterium]
VSAGDRDLVREILGELGAKQLFWKVDIKPGRPLAFAIKKGVPIFSLPGNPVSTMITFEEFVRPALLKLMGQRQLLKPLVHATLQEPLRKKPGRVQLLRVTVQAGTGGLVVVSSGDQNTGILRTSLHANGIAVLPFAHGDYVAGDAIPVHLLGRDAEWLQGVDAEKTSRECKVVSFIARSGTGKTTLLEQVIAELKRRGYKVGAIKHDAHRFEIDHPGKDSIEQAGAGQAAPGRSPDRGIAGDLLWRCRYRPHRGFEEECPAEDRGAPRRTRQHPPLPWRAARPDPAGSGERRTAGADGGAAPSRDLHISLQPSKLSITFPSWRIGVKYSQQQLEQITALARGYGATRLFLFGSALDSPETARDLDLACDGVPGWKLYELAARLEDELSIPFDLVPLSPPNRFTRLVESRGRRLI